MKLFIALVVSLATTYSANAVNFRVEIAKCYGAAYNPYEYERCSIQNMRKLENTLNIQLEYCSGVDYNPFHFEQCNNSNMSKLKHKFGIGLRRCSSLKRNPYSYEACNNGNYERINRYLKSIS